MNSKTQSEPDSTLRVHLDTINSQHQLNNKVTYALACIHNAIALTNNSRRPNIFYLKKYKDIFLKLISQATTCKPDQLQYLLFIINSITAQQPLKENEEQSVIKLISKADLTEEGISEQLCQQINSFCFRAHHCHKCGEFIVSTVISKLSPAQLIRFINSFSNNQFHYISVLELIKLAKQYQNQLNVLTKILEIMHWRIINFLANRPDNDEEVRNSAKFLAETGVYNINHHSILALCGLAYTQLTKGRKQLFVSSNIDIFLRQNVQSNNLKPYIPSKDIFLEDFSQLKEILKDSSIIISNIDFQHLLLHFSKNPFPWRNELQGFSAKNPLFKELLLRATQPFQNTVKSNRIGMIGQQQEMNIVRWIPISCIRNVGSLLQKITISGAFQAFEALNIIQKLNRNHPKYQQLLVKLVEIAIQNRDFKSLEQVSRIVQNEVNPQTVIAKLKQKASVKNINSNKQSKRYFSLIPLLLNKQQVQTHIIKEIEDIFGYQTISLELKFYVADFLLRKMVTLPLRKFAAYLIRTIQTSQNDSVFKIMSWYLKNLENLSPANIDWITANFAEESQRILQLLFANLIGSKGTSACNLLFQLQKMNAYGNKWHHAYRWVLLALQQVSDQTQTLDYLQLFQMILQKISSGSLQKEIVRRFQKLVTNNWYKYTHQHYFALQRILQLINQHYLTSFSKHTLPQVQQMSKQHLAFSSQAHQNINNKNNPLVDFVKKMSWNLFFQHTDKSTTVHLILQIIKNNDLDITKFFEYHSFVLKNLLYSILYIYEDGEEVAPKEIDLLIFNTVLTENSTSIQHKLLKGLCLQYLSRVPHSINILKLPLNNLLTQGFKQTDWINAINQLLEVVIESKPKAIGSFKLQNVIKSVLMRLISLQGGVLQQFLDFIEITCFTEGDYENFLGKNLKLVFRILNAQMHGVGYRPSLVLFMIQLLQNYEVEFDSTLLLFLLTKYANQSDIVKILLEKLQKEAVSKQLLDQHLLMRLVLVHTQDNQIQQQCKTIFDNNIPAANTEKQFVSLFADAKYENCEDIVQKVTNPFALNLSQAEIRTFIQWKHAATKSKKVLNLLYNLPQSNIKIHNCDAFYMNKDYITYLNQSLEVIKSDFILNSFITYKETGNLNLKQNRLEKVIFERLSSIIRGKNTSLQFKALILDVAKNSQDLLAVIIELVTTVLGNYRKYDNYSRANLEIYYNFCRQIVGICLTNSQPPDRNIKQIVYMFPLVASDLHQNETTINHLLRHYFALVQNFKIIEKDIGILKYIVKVQDQILKRFSQQENNGALQYYQKLCTSLESRNEVNISQIKAQTFTVPHKNFVSYLLGLITIYVRGKISDTSNKITVNFVIDYTSTILYTLANGLSLDPQTHSNLSTIYQKLQSYSFTEENFKILGEALIWLLKKGSSNKNAEPQANVTKANDYMIQTPRKEASQLQQHYVSRKQVEVANSTQKEKKNEIIKQMQKQYGELALYQSLRPTQKQQVDDNESKKEVQEAYIRFKQTEQYVTIHEHEITTNTTVLIIDEGSPPKQKTQPVQQRFDQKNFLEETKVVGPTDRQRTQNLEIAQKIQNQQFSIQSLKDHCKFIAFLADLSTISDKEFQQLLISSTSITETVLSHTFYVKKVMDAETVFKLIKIYKHLHVIKGKQSWGGAVVLKILHLCVAITQKKQKKMQIFADQQSMKFFKLVVKRALNGQNIRQEIDYLIQVLFSCRANTEVYFKEGLFSMIVELVNRNIHPDLVIDYLNRIDLTSQFINEIYQRDLFNKLMIVVAKEPTNQHERTLLNLWVKLAGKVCINQSIQQKFKSKQLHVKVWNRFQKTTILPQQLNLCFFFSYFCVKNEGICQWLIKNKVLQQLLNGLKGIQQNEQLYLFFYHFCFNNDVSRDYCFRIKYHLHLIDRLNGQGTEEEKAPLSKYFFKSLGQMMNSKLYVSTFYKEQIVKKLIDIYNNKTEPAVYECLLDFISILQTDSQFDELKKQNFWSSLKIFEYKMNSEATYSYLLQIFLVMIKKGRTKEFNHHEVRSKACLKAQYSINMDGKELALRFIIALSIKNKESYLTQRCVRLLASIMGFKVTQNELLITLQMLKIEGSAKNSDFLDYFCTNNVVSLIIDAFHTFNQQTAALAIQILSILAVSPANSKNICSQMLTILQKELKNEINLKKITQLLVTLSNTKQNQDILQNSQIITQLTTVQVLQNVKKANAEQQYSQLISTLSQRQLIKEQELKTVSKLVGSQNLKANLEKVSQKMSQQGLNDDFTEKAYISLREGRKVKMYKTDGSISELFIWITSDRLELNCATKPSEVVKAKWRLPINQIRMSIVFNSQQCQQFLNSVFEKNSGFFSKAPSFDCCLSLMGKNNEFHICFNSKSQKEIWMADLALLIENAKKLFNKLK